MSLNYAAINQIGLIMHLKSAQLALLNTASDKFEQADLLKPHVLELLGLTKKDLDEARDFAFLEGLAILSLLNPRATMLF
ncbi:MAG: hypothetical protein U5L01_00845 [Rheinheimera sp.]|nr:hypothetical protein [Rheinheimera sp.]